VYLALSHYDMNMELAVHSYAWAAATENLHLHAEGTRKTPPLLHVSSIRLFVFVARPASHDHAVWIQIRNASKVCDVVLPPCNSWRTRNFFGAPRSDNTFPSNFETSRSKKSGRWDTIAVTFQTWFFFLSPIDLRLLFRESLSNGSLKSEDGLFLIVVLRVFGVRNLMRYVEKSKILRKEREE